MKVLYGIQCTGNGHITRSIEIINELRKYVRVDVLTSGSHSEVKLPFEVKYKQKGLAYYFGKNGSIDVVRTVKENNPKRFLEEVKTTPTHLYDMVISDFEPVTAWSAKRNWVYSVGLSNQASLLDADVPKPKVISPISKLIINNCCPANRYYGLHYQKLNAKLYYPPVREVIKNLNPTEGTDYIVYLPFYGTEKLVKYLTLFPEVTWRVFSKHTTIRYTSGNVHVQPIDETTFIAALEGCKGVLCSAGFGTTSEALYLNKKLLVIPMKSQYEQQCNAHSLSLLGVPAIPSLKKKHHTVISDWIASNVKPTIEMKDENNRLVRDILEDYVASGIIKPIDEV
jgi:uncharacterized protein (TIGR00661 family)